MNQTDVYSKKISVIVPVYNVQDLIGTCIESVLNQTFPHFELILVDDGSKDHSREICERYAFGNSRIHFLTKANGGVSSARNLGLAYATGEWVTFIDSDDFVTPDFLAQLYQHIAPDAKAQFVIGGTQTVDRYGQNKDRIWAYPDITLEGSECARLFTTYGLFYTGPWSKLYDRNLIERKTIRFREDISYSEDVLFMAEYLFHVERVVLFSSLNYKFRIWSNSTLSNKISPFENEVACFRYYDKVKNELMTRFGTEPDVPEILERHRFMFLRRTLYALYRSPESGKSRRRKLFRLIKPNEKNILTYWEKAYLMDRIGVQLLYRHQLHLYDAYMVLLYFLRKAMGTHWYGIRKWILK